MLEPVTFLDYCIFSEAGYIIGIQEEEIKKEYAAYLKEKEEAAKLGIKL